LQGVKAVDKGVHKTNEKGRDIINKFQTEKSKRKKKRIGCRKGENSVQYRGAVQASGGGKNILDRREVTMNRATEGREKSLLSNGKDQIRCREKKRKKKRQERQRGGKGRINRRTGENEKCAGEERGHVENPY